MYQSESESNSFIEQQQEFIIHQPSQNFEIQSVSSNWQNIYEIEKHCWEKSQQILTNSIQRLAKQIQVIVRKSCTQFSFNQTNNKKITLLPLFFRKDQEMYVQRLIPHVIHQINSFNRDNDPNKVNIQCFQTNQDTMGAIALKVHQKFYKKDISKKQIIVVNRCITNISVENTRILEDGFQQLNLKFILPTFSSFSTFNNNKYGKLQVIERKFYDNNLIFYEFMHSCVFDSHIKAYLPKQGLRLLYQIAQFPISYSQACKRLIYCIRKLHILAFQKGRQIQYVQIYEIFKVIQDSFIENLQHKMIQNPYELNYRHKMKHISLMLDETATYNITDAYLSRVQLLQLDISIDRLIEKIRSVLKNKLQRLPSMNEYAKYLQQNPYQFKQQRKMHRKIENRYLMDTSKNYPQNIIFEEQIKRIIIKCSQKIRNQTRHFNWSQFQYQNTIKPMIPYQVYQNIVQKPQLRYIIKQFQKGSQVNMINLCSAIQEASNIQKYETILCNYDTKTSTNNIANNINKHEYVKAQFEIETNEQQINNGRVLYALKQLELYGFISISSTAINDKVYLQYFPKAKYWLSKVDNNFKVKKQKVWL